MTILGSGVLRVLLTNDDGIDAEGLLALRRELAALDDVELAVVALLTEEALHRAVAAEVAEHAARRTGGLPGEAVGAEVHAVVADLLVLLELRVAAAGPRRAVGVASAVAAVVDAVVAGLLAGDDADAKTTLAGVFTSGGLDVIDAGSLKRARELEAVGFLQLTLAVNEKVSWTGGFGIAA